MFNLRAQQYQRLRDRMYRTWEAVENGVYHDPDTLISFSSDIKLLNKLRSEICRLPLKPNGNNKIQLWPKEVMKSRFKIPSPNLADSAKMSIRNPVKKRKFVAPGYATW